MPMPTEITASVAITAAPCSPTAISSDSRMIPAPVVPPASPPQPNEIAASPRSESARPRRRISHRSGTLAIIIPPITSMAPLPVSMV